MRAVCITPPATEPVSLAEARLHIKEIAVGADIDAKLQDAIQAARELCENDARCALITQTWKVVFDRFPSRSSWFGPQWGDLSSGNYASLGYELLPDGYSLDEILLPYPPLQSIDSVKYLDDNGVQQTMVVDVDYAVDIVSVPGRVVPAFNTRWPSQRNQSGAMEITFTCGYGSADKVPRCAKQYILALIGTMDVLRQSEMAVWRETLLVPAYVERLLDPIRIRRY